MQTLYSVSINTYSVLLMQDLTGICFIIYFFTCVSCRGIALSYGLTDCLADLDYSTRMHCIIIDSFSLAYWFRLTGTVVPSSRRAS
jgi:hypothetical protein